MAELSFFIGKGGVGKTTLAAAYAVRSSLRYPSDAALLVSSDPAHSLADVLQVRLSDSPKRIPLRSRCFLNVWEMNAQKLFAGFLRKNKAQILELVERGSLFTAQEISPLLDTALPGMAEIAALLAIQEAIESDKYRFVVVDTAPFGHTLRLFSLPEQFSKLLNFLELAASRDRVLAEHFGGTVSRTGVQFIDEWRRKLQQLERSFASAKLFLITTAGNFALNESTRSLATLFEANSGMKLAGIVLNRIVHNPGKCLRCRKRAKAERSAQARLRHEFPAAQLLSAEDPGSPILGVSQLRKFAAHVFDGKRLPPNSIVPKPTTRFRLQPAEWPELQAPLTFVAGKGGVGKTTISAGLGFHTRRSDSAVEICSVDPAPSLDDIFETAVTSDPKSVLGDRQFRALEFDALTLFKNWVAEVKGEIDDATRTEVSGVHVDLSFERQLFSELLEIVPPGLDEVLAVFQIIEMRRQSAARIIIDMAPTGHALELLRMPERILVWSRLLLKTLARHRKLALARNAAVRIAELELHARELSTALRHSKDVEVFVVMLPELLPDRETQRLLRQLHKLGVVGKKVFVNRVILPGKAGSCRRCRMTAACQAAVFSTLSARYHGKDFYIVPDFECEIAGRRGLRSLTHRLWRLN